jgi:SAM-dependent methyltransferase
MFFRRLLHALDNHGLRGLIRRAPASLPLEAAPHPFDLAHRTDTAGYIPGETLTPRNRDNTAYYAISPSSLAHALTLLPQPACHFPFIDIGCGKGRALLLAATFPFPSILGIELSAQLCAIARANTAAHPRITIHQADAVDFALPDTPLVLFLYHPFLAPTLRRLLRNLRKRTHLTYLLYANCTYHRVLLAAGFHQLWEYAVPLSPQDAAHDRHGTTHERYTLFRN